MNRVISVLEKNGPMLSGELAEYMQKIYGITNESARKAISRVKSPVHRIAGIKFKNNQRYVYLSKQYKNYDYFKNLFNVFKENSKNYYQILLAIHNNGGYISKNVLASYVAAPIENVKRHKKYDLIINELIELEFINEQMDGYYQLDYPFDDKYDIKRVKAIELVKKTVIDDFRDWAKNVNFIGYNSSRGFYESANFAKFQWSFTAPSYINDIFNNKKNIPGFLIGDILYKKNTEINDVQFFIDKIDIIKNFKNIPNFIPIIISENFTQEAHQLLKRKGVICATFSNLFSANYANLLNGLVNIISSASIIISKNSDELLEYTKKISSLEGKMGNLIGDLFEVTVGYYFHEIGCKYFELNKLISYENKNKEIDVYVEKDGKIKVIECKGIKNKLDHEYVKKWLHENIPVIYKFLIKSRPNAKIEFELWSTGGYIDESIELLKKSQENTEIYSISYFDADEIINKAKDNNCEVLLKSIKSILN